MAEMPNLEPNSEAEFRPRSGTWPMNRPNIPPRRQERSSAKLGTTLEEGNPLELSTVDQDLMLFDPSSLMKDDYLQMLSDSMPTELDNIMMGISTGPVDLDNEYSATSNMLVKSESQSDILTDTMIQFPTYKEQNFDDNQATSSQNMNTNTRNISVNSSSTVSDMPTVPMSQLSTTTASGATPKAKSARKNAWGSMSYADLITQAIESSPEKRLTLAQVYDWMVKNITYFKDKGETNSSAGWKNSIRHNLSLHSKFKRVQNEGTGKSSWWMINYEAKAAKTPRRHTVDNHNKALRQKSLKAKQKADLLKKQKTAHKGREPNARGSDAAPNLETTVSKVIGSEYRTIRTSSNASSIDGRISPRFCLPQDLAEQSAPPLSPFGSAANLANLSSSLPPAFDIFSILQAGNTPSTSAQGTVNTDSVLHDELLESLAGMDVISRPVQYTDQIKSEAGMYLHQPDSTLQSSSRDSLTDAAIRERPNLATLLQKSPPKRTADLVEKQEPTWDNSEIPYGYSEYHSPQLVNPAMQSPPQFGNWMQPHYAPPPQNVHEGPQYLSNRACQQQVTYSQQPAGGQQYAVNQERLQQMASTRTYSGQESNLLRMGKFPSDINLDNQDILDSGDFDMAEALHDNYSPFDLCGMDFESNGKQPSFVYDQGQIQQPGSYMMGSSQMMRQQPPPAMYHNPATFMASRGNGVLPSIGGMMDGCRLVDTNRQRTVQPVQASSVGTVPTYTLQ